MHSASADRMPGATLPASRPSSGTGILYAGTARVDVTPPPGASTFGHGPDSRVAHGYWTRLYCRVFALETEGGARFAIVPCDLAAMSQLLQRSVAARLGDIGLDATRVMITATHTHAGPAHYFNGASYNGVFSTRLPGFDPEMVSMLTDAISSGIRSAFNDMKRASISWAETDLWGATRNRSLLAYRSNGPAPPGPQRPGCVLSEEQSAVDPTLLLLRIDELDREGTRVLGPMGSVAFFAMHPTVLPHTNRFYGADTHGVISRVIEREMRREWGDRLQGRDPLHGVINTNEGDVCPVWASGSREEAEIVGRRIAGRIWRLSLASTPTAPRAAADARLALSRGDPPWWVALLGLSPVRGG